MDIFTSGGGGLGGLLGSILGGLGGGGGAKTNPQTGQPYGTTSDEIIPQNGRYPGDPGSGGIGGGPGPASGGGGTGGGGEATANPLASILLGVGAPLISKLMGSSEDKAINKATKNQQRISNTSTDIGTQLLQRAAAGQLTDPQQAQVDAMKKEQNAHNAQYLAGLGIPVSSSNAQYQNQVETNAVKLSNDLINQSFQQGISALNLGGPVNQQIIANAMKQREDLGKTIGEVAQEIGHVMNTPGQKTGQPAGGTLSTQAGENIAKGAEQWGSPGDYGSVPTEAPDTGFA